MKQGFNILKPAGSSELSGRPVRTGARLTGSTADADDVVQESLLQAWQQMDTLRDKGAVRAWLMRITGSRGIDCLRRRKHYPFSSAQMETFDPATGPEEAAVLNAGMSALSLALGLLPEDQRKCWALKEIGGLSYEDIAHELNISPVSVRGKLARARATLLRRMENWQ
ncbi:RNA polymerase sigma factor [Arthrobacter sp. UYEF20]|uniref:RNA polymerase sigma factor n=1 Tax=Arthrobacter sp. UYEF20 TaxID=1756363 RepID=UPI0033948324